MLVLLFLAELVALYFFSILLTQRLYNLFLLVFRARSIAVMLVTLLQFPGTAVHELAHLFTASILGVKAGKLTLAPESIRGEDIRVGSVTVAHTDPFRRYAIGLAPLFAGILSLTAIAYFLSGILDHVLHSGMPLLANTNTYLLILLSYLLFAVSNAMFSSSEDLKGFAPFAITIGILIAAGYFLGLRIQLTGASLILVNRVLTTLVRSIGVVLILNIVLLVVTGLVTLGLERLTHQRLVQS